MFPIHKKVLCAIHLVFHLHHDNNSYADYFGNLGWTSYNFRRSPKCSGVENTKV